jgi:hypothetical protein
MYQLGWLSFNSSGINITSFPHFFGETVGNYNLSGINTNSNQGKLVDENDPDNEYDLIYEITTDPKAFLYYYSTEAGAGAGTDDDFLGISANPKVGVGVVTNLGERTDLPEDVNLPSTSWRIIGYSDGSSPQNVIYRNGDILNDGFYVLYPAIPCFLEETTILCQIDGVETYLPVEQLKNGTLVKTSLDGYKPIVLIGKGTIENPGNNERTENRLYKCSTSKYPDLKEDLYITGCHSILEFPITEKQEKDTIKYLGKLFVTDKKYRLMACVDERAEPWNCEGTYTIWHFALENNNEKMNYGVYANGGLLVETCSINFLKNKTNMTIM